MSGYVTPAAPLRATVESLVDGGIREVVICPGSRSTPMALALQAAAGLRTWIHLDERAGAFFALGAARATHRPVAVLATSGTAAVEFAPAVVEARYGRVPLVLLTADRPPELQGVGAAQTIDQVELYGRHAKWFAELPVPDDATAAEAEVRSLVGRALEVATVAPAGPVQLNLPYREPLLPAGPLATDARATSVIPAGTPAVPAAAIETLLHAAHAAAHPLIVCGPCEDVGLPAAISRLATSLGAPVVADVLAGLRDGPHDRAHVVAAHEVLFRSAPFLDAHRPDLVVRFGGTPVSKALTRWLDDLAVPQLLVDDGAGWNRPRGRTLSRIDADPSAFAEAGAEAVRRESSADPAWLEGWIRAGRAAVAALDTWFGELAEPFEGAVARALATALPDGALVVAGNSMPVRDLDAFLPGSSRDLRVLGNRGANGIDGLVSTTLGVAAVASGPTVGVVGDLAFLHDLNAIAMGTRLGLDATIVLVDNDGGGIFSFLPQAAASDPALGLPEQYERLFGTPHGLDLGPVTTALGARHVAVDGATVAAALREAAVRPGIDVLHLRTERSRNAELHRAAFAAANAAVQATLEVTR